MNRRNATSATSAILAATVLATQAAQPLRDLSTDRPDTTESPFTVDAGHWQIETEISAWTFDDRDLDSYSLGEMNIKYGVTEDSDIQFVVPLYSHTRNGEEGFGDFQIRYKTNLTGQSDSAPAYSTPGIGIMPYLKCPTAPRDLGNGEFEGGLILPVAIDLAYGWSLGLMAQLDLIADEDSGGHQLAPVASAAAGRDITETLGGFLELVAAPSPEGNQDHEAYFNAGLTWAQCPHTQWDAGVRIGLCSASADFSPFLGISKKF